MTEEQEVVYITRVDDDYESIKDGVRTAFEEIGFNLKHDKVLIKPNIVEPINPKKAVVTDPRVVEGIIEYLEPFSPQIVVGEASKIGVDVEEAFKVCGYARLEDHYGVELVDLNSVERKNFQLNHNSISLPKLLEDSCYINVPKLKTHVLTTVTLGLKNQKGLLTEEDKKLMHLLGLHQPLAQLATIAHPDITLIDATYGIEGNGPGLRGRKRKMGLLIAGNNVVSADAVCCRVIGFNPEEIPHIKTASKLGAGSLNPEIRGIPLEKVQTSFRPPDKPPRYKLFNAYLWLGDTTCSACSGIEMMDYLKKNPWWIPKVFYHTVLRRVDFLLGKNPHLPEKHSHLICLGNCSREYAKHYNLKWVPGCPCSPENILKAL